MKIVSNYSENKEGLRLLFNNEIKMYSRFQVQTNILEVEVFYEDAFAYAFKEIHILLSHKHLHNRLTHKDILLLKKLYNSKNSGTIKFENELNACWLTILQHLNKHYKNVKNCGDHILLNSSDYTAIKIYLCNWYFNITSILMNFDEAYRGVQRYNAITKSRSEVIYPQY